MSKRADVTALLCSFYSSSTAFVSMPIRVCIQMRTFFFIIVINSTQAVYFGLLLLYCNDAQAHDPTLVRLHNERLFSANGFVVAAAVTQMLMEFSLPVYCFMCDAKIQSFPSILLCRS